MPLREVFCMDAIDWLNTNKNNECIITSIPSRGEVKIRNVKEYETFFRLAVKKIFEATKDDGYVIFLQTDEKHNGLIDKCYLIADEAVKAGYNTIWKTIALTRSIGIVNSVRQTYSNLICYSKKNKVGKKTIPNTIYAGEIRHPSGFGLDAVRLCVDYVKSRGITKIIDPFCGSGSTLLIANEKGLDSVGVDIDADWCEKAKCIK